MLSYPCRLEFSSEGSKWVAISVMQGSVTVKRIYVNNNNCDS